MTPLDLLPGARAVSPVDLNNFGHAVGFVRSDSYDPNLPYGAVFATLWKNGKAIDLGVWPGLDISTASAMNDVGQILSHSQSSDFFSGRDVIHWNIQMFDFRSLLPEEPSLFGFGGGRIINNRGQIISGNVLMTPVSPVGDLDNNCTVNVLDLVLLLAEWGETNSFADVDEDNDVDVFDLIDLFQNWD